MPGCFLLEACSFLMRDIKGVDLKRMGDGKEQGTEGGKIVVRIYYMRKEYTLHKKMGKIHDFSKVTA